MRYSDVKVKAVQANIGHSEIQITLTLDMTDENLAKAKELSPWTDKDSGYVDVEITPRQLPLIRE